MRALFLANLIFSMVAAMKTLFKRVTFCHQVTTIEFIAFVISDVGQNLMTNNSLSIHIESVNIFYHNFNTNENFYSFLLAQRDQTEAIIPKRVSYHCNF